MALSLRTALFLTACAAPATLFACGSSSSGTGASTTSSTATGGSTTSSSHTGGSTTTGDAGGDGGISACQAKCIQQNGAAYQKFLGYALQACGCTAGAACASSCSSDCASVGDGGASDGGSLSSGCSSCLSAQEAMGLSSTCLLTAGGNCATDPSCTAFVTCEEGC